MDRRIVVLFGALMLISSWLPTASQAQVVDSVTIAMLDYPPRQATSGDYALVGGVLHNITVSLSQASDNVRLTAYLDAELNATNNTNYYQWSYQAGNWSDDLYAYFIREAESSRQGNTFNFIIGTAAGAQEGTWRLAIFVDDVEEYNNTFELERPWAGISMTAPTFYFQVVPYGSGYINSYNAADPVNSTDFNTKNIGNVPIDMSITFDQFNAQFATSNSTGIFSPGEERVHFVEFQAQPWSPRKFTVKGRVSGEPQILVTPATVSCSVAPQTVFDVVVIVARQGYDVFQIEGVTVQYKRLFAAQYRNSVTMDLYLTGNRSLYFGVDGDNLTISDVQYLGESRNHNFLMSVRDDSEAHVVVNITCSIPPPRSQSSMSTYANFAVELSDFSDSGTFAAVVVVGQGAADDDDDIGLGPPSMIALVIILVAVCILAVFLFKTKRDAELERRRELEDRIRQRKEKVRKRRKQ